MTALSLLSKEGGLELLLVQGLEQDQAGCKLGIVIAQSMNHGHRDQLSIKISKTVGLARVLGVQSLDLGHALLNPGNKGAQGLIRALPDGEEVVPGVETRSRKLLDMGRLEGGPDLDRVVLNVLKVQPLVCRAVEKQFTCCLVLLLIPLGLLLRLRGWRATLLARDKQPESLSAQVGLHLSFPGRVVGLCQHSR
jgi:hypothetical protein